MTEACLSSLISDRSFTLLFFLVGFGLRSALQRQGLGLVLKGTVNRISLSIETPCGEPKKSGAKHKEVGWGSGHRH